MRVFTIATFLLTLSFALVSTAQEDHPAHWDGSRNTPVHLLRLVDEEGQTIVPSFERSMPFSARQTCGACHDYATISGGFHFNSTTPGTSSGRPGEPWVWVDPSTGTQIPLSYRGWEGTFKPDELGISPWNFTKLFGRHLPGGDMAEPEDPFADVNARWDVSGPLEVNCLGCHNASPNQDMSEWAKQIGRENFRWAATAASGLASVPGTASRIHGSWAIHDGRNPDDLQFAVPPAANYDKRNFDAKDQTIIDVAYKSPDENCLQCHSASPANSQRWKVQEDIHSAVGMQCADCHRNGLDHNIIRGYQGEADERNDAHVAAYSCAGCHLGDSAPQAAPTAGGLGAPVPAHKGMPPVHFDKLTCTVCHSGPWPESEPQSIRTSRVNRLGIHGRAQWFTEAPQIQQPVYVRGEDGIIAPHRMIWPAFWAKRDGNDVTPIAPNALSSAARAILDADRQVGDILVRLAAGTGAFGQPVFLTPGNMYSRNVDGGLDPSPYTGGLEIDNFRWGTLVEGEVQPLLIAFDPNAEMVDFDAEDRLLNVFKALTTDVFAPTQPVVILGDKIFSMTPDEYIEITPNTDTSPGRTMTLVWRTDDQITPLLADYVISAVTETADVDEVFTEAQVALVLAELDSTGQASSFAYVSSGKLFRLDTSGRLIAEDHPAAAPYTWPLGHDVRPAAQSLGVKGCTDCHDQEAPFFFATLNGNGPLRTNSVASLHMYEAEELDANFQELFGLSFKYRSYFKYVLAAASAILCVLILIYTLAGLAKLCKLLGRNA